MSTFLGFTSALVPSGSTVPGTQALFASLLASYGWQVVRQAVNPLAILSTFNGAGANAPSAALDMSGASSATTTTLPAYIGVQTGGFTPTVMYVQTDGPSQVSATNPAPKNFTLDWSPDGSTWTTQQSFTNEINWTFGERRRYAISGAASHPYWRINVTAVQSGTTCYLAEWQLEDTNGNWVTSASFFDVIPPATEAIGTSVSRQVLRWEFTTTTVRYRPLSELLTALPQMISFHAATAGAVTCSITLGGATVSYTGTASNTSYQNARGLYEALRASANANFTAWNWVWNSATNSWSGGGQIFGFQVTPAMSLLPTSSNITTWALAVARSSSVYGVPLVQSVLLCAGVTHTIDLSNGFIYFLQVNTRGLAIAMKTSAGYSNVCHMCYGDHTSSVSQIPVADFATYGLPCTIIELIVGTDEVVGNTGGSGGVSHLWGVPNSFGNIPAWGGIDSSTGEGYAPFAHNFVAAQLQDISLSAYIGALNTVTMSANGEGVFHGADAGSGYSIHRLSLAPGSTDGSGLLNPQAGGGITVRSWGPTFYNLDWYKFNGTAPSQEQLVIGPSWDYTTTVTVSGTVTDATITVASTTGFPATGWIILEGEIISYTGLTGTTFTGCVRGKYNSTAVSPLVGATVYIGGWWVFVTPGLLFAGYQTPH